VCTKYLESIIKLINLILVVNQQIFNEKLRSYPLCTLKPEAVRTICNNYYFFTSVMVAQKSLRVTLLSCLYDNEMLLLSVETHPWYICELVTEFGQDSRIGLTAICETHLVKSCIHKESLLPQVVPFHTILSSPSHYAQSIKHRILQMRHISNNWLCL